MNAALHDALARIDRDFPVESSLRNFKASIQGDADLYVAVDRIREGTLSKLGIETREHAAVRRALRAKFTAARTLDLRKTLMAAYLGEGRLFGLRDLHTIKYVARRFAPAVPA